MLTETEIEEKYRVNPINIGLLFCDYWLVTEPDAEDRKVKAQPGDLVVSTLDGKDIDISAGLCINYIGTIRDPEDPIYRYYYFKETDCFENYNNNSTRCKECNVAVECYESGNYWG